MAIGMAAAASDAACHRDIVMIQDADLEYDLDIELVMKLVRKDYLPLEIPVNCASRSFAEGKKVSFYAGRADLGRHDPSVPVEGDRSGPDVLAIASRLA